MVACGARVDMTMRRFFIVSAFWLGLLGVAEPLLACAMTSLTSECCPTDTQAPCNDDSRSAGAPVDAHQHCCASAPIGEPLAVSIQKSGTKFLHGVPTAAELPLIVAPDVGFCPLSAAFSHRLRFADPASSFGASTYLRTGRLRL